MLRPRGGADTIVRQERDPQTLGDQTDDRFRGVHLEEVLGRDVGVRQILVDQAPSPRVSVHADEGHRSQQVFRRVSWQVAGCDEGERLSPDLRPEQTFRQGKVWANNQCTAKVTALQRTVEMRRRSRHHFQQDARVTFRYHPKRGRDDADEA